MDIAPKPRLVKVSDRPAEGTTVRSLNGAPIDLRQLRVDEFFKARSFKPNTERNYQQDLAQFMTWTKTAWNDVTPRQVADFKDYLKHQGGRDATICRKLSSLKSFFGWLSANRYVDHNPTLTVELPELQEPEAQDLSEQEVELVFEIAAQGNYPERDIALIHVLLHGLRASEVSGLDIADYTERGLKIRKAKRNSTGNVPLLMPARTAIDTYLDWRVQQGEKLDRNAPLFTAQSPRCKGERLQYSGIWYVVDQIGAAIPKDDPRGDRIRKSGKKRWREDEGLHPHRFRHTFCTTLASSGMAPSHAMTISRHRSLSSYERYIKRVKETVAEQAFYEAFENSPQNME